MISGIDLRDWDYNSTAYANTVATQPAPAVPADSLPIPAAPAALVVPVVPTDPL